MKLHKKYGVNPTLPVCFICGKEKGEIVLLGNSIKEEAPMKMCLDKEPCNQCKEYMKQGIILVGVKDNTDQANPYRTGQFYVVTEDFINKIMEDPMRADILTKRICFVEETILDKLGFNSTNLKGGKNEKIQ